MGERDDASPSFLQTKNDVLVDKEETTAFEGKSNKWRSLCYQKPDSEKCFMFPLVENLDLYAYVHMYIIYETKSGISGAERHFTVGGMENWNICDVMRWRLLSVKRRTRGGMT